MTIDMSQFLQTFYEESFEGLDIMENGLLNLNAGEADVDEINTIFRAAHSIKGGSATFGLSNVANFTHVLETLLDEMRDGRRDVTQEAVNLLLQSVDILRGMLNACRDESEYDHTDANKLQKELETLLGQEATADNVGAGSSASTSAETGIWRIRFRPDENVLRTGNDVVRMFSMLADLGEIEVEADMSGFPSIHDMDAESSYLGWTIKLHSKCSLDDVKEVFEWVEDESELVIEAVANERTSNQKVGDRIPETAGKPASDTQKRNTSSGGKDTSSIRVGIDKVDSIINMVGELVITQSMLNQLGTDFDMTKLPLLQEGLSELERNTRELQENVMRIRMLPISFVFNRFPRLIHDLGQQLNKNIELKMTGEHTELDKTVMEKIGDPMVHLVRNSVDHGIESPEARRAAGKPEIGTVQLNAYHKGGNIIIEIIDDGAGINKEKVLAKARKQGMVGEDEVLPDEKIYDLVFQPGFSTADVVSDVSGRGVGMDVVRRNILSLGGSVDVKSEEGKGSQFTIRLPLTLAILDGQLVKVGGQTYIIPLVSIIESLQANKENINSIAGKAELYRLRNEYIPVVRLYESFKIKPDTTELTKGLLVVVEGDGQRAGLFVDDLLGQQQVVIKSLESNFRRVDGVSGATILGDGTVALILDVPGLIRVTHESSKPRLVDSTGNEAA
ncbi:MAG: chemotaxis protein CheA [Gammaproteobacteria bacterium]|nr:chemotaxis protein CheA [Gammaproteobacteria bacterium]